MTPEHQPTPAGARDCCAPVGRIPVSAEGGLRLLPVAPIGEEAGHDGAARD